MNNPFTEVYDRLWEILEDFSDLTDLVKAGNRIKHGGREATVDEDSAKSARMAGDLPELELVPVGTALHLWATSSSHELVLQYGLQVRTDRLQIDVAGGINAIKWQLLRAVRAAGRNPFSGLGYGVEMRMLPWSEGSEPEDDEEPQRRSARGWNLGMLLECRLAITDTDMAG